MKMERKTEEAQGDIGEEGTQKNRIGGKRNRGRDAGGMGRRGEQAKKKEIEEKKGDSSVERVHENIERKNR